MVWARTDDNANSDVKLLALSDGAYRMWDAGKIYCAKGVTEGFIPDYAIVSFGVRAPKQKCIAELCAVLVSGKKPLWHRVEGGYQMNDYLDWNDPREVIDRKKALGAERLRRWRENRAKCVNGTEQRVTERVTERDRERVQNARPVPSTKEHKNPQTPADAGAPPSVKSPTRKERQWAIEYRRARQRQHEPPCPHEPDCVYEVVCVGRLVEDRRAAEAQGQRLSLVAIR